MSGRFLFATWDGSGNLPPQLALATRLHQRGHDVRFLAHEAVRPRIEATGCAFSGYRRVENLYDRPSLPPEDVWWDELFMGAGPGRELLADLERAPADVLVVDCQRLL